MREIKFRAYDTERNVWLNNEDLIFHNGLWFINFRAFEDYVNLDTNSGKIKISQYTGLKDYNGKEIYKGDILHDFSDELPMIVEWDEDLACFKLCARINGCLEFEYKVYEIHLGGLEVIGNIYEK